MQVVSCKTEFGNIVDCKSDKVAQRAADNKGQDMGFDDMINMDILNDSELLYNLQKRFLKGVFFTYIGPTLLVINPFKLYPELYTKQEREKYIKHIVSAKNNPLVYKDLPPHIYAIAAEAYRSLYDNNRSQIIVISGESGAGKTENAKFSMNLLTSIGQTHEDMSGSNLQREASIEDKILKCNPILEAFGNAKTTRNSNSSRFGKYVRIMVDSQHRIKGAQIINYLLEKSRITSPGINERNFHVFYHFLAGVSQEEQQKYFLTKDAYKQGNASQRLTMDQFEYLRKSDCYVVDKINDQQLFNEAVEAINVLEFNEYKHTIFSLIAAILHMGNIDFDDSTFGNETPCELKDGRIGFIVSYLLGLESKEFVRIITSKTRQYGKAGTIDSPLSRIECINGLQSFSRDIYDKLFNWLVLRLNETIAPKKNKHQTDNTQDLFVGLLDIYGFEVFQFNTFEQLFINYTNERLHNLYIFYVFQMVYIQNICIYLLRKRDSIYKKNSKLMSTPLTILTIRILQMQWIKHPMGYLTFLMIVVLQQERMNHSSTKLGRTTKIIKLLWQNSLNPLIIFESFPRFKPMPLSQFDTLLRKQNILSRDFEPRIRTKLINKSRFRYQSRKTSLLGKYLN